jgi:RimJ/RimL family protein N-acetyltransferase
LIHKEPEKAELKRIWGNWLLMTPEQKAESDKKSIELFGKTNAEHYKELISIYKESLAEELTQIEYRPLSDIELFKKYAVEILGGYGNQSDNSIMDNSKEIYIDDKLVGYISFDEYDDVEDYNKVLGFGNFMILERGKGYGTKVIKDLVDRYKNEFDLIYCFVDADNTGALNLYKKLGTVYDEDGPNDNGQYYVTFWDKHETEEKEN